MAVLPGVGPATSKILGRLKVHTIADLLTLYPRDYEDRTRVELLREVAERLNPGGAGQEGLFGPGSEGQPGCVLVRVVEHVWFGRTRRKNLKIVVADESARASLVCFNRPFLQRSMPVGDLFYVFAKWNRRLGELQAGAFEVEPHSDRPRGFLRVLPVYPLTEGLTQTVVRRAVAAALRRVTGVEEELPQRLLPRITEELGNRENSIRDEEEGSRKYRVLREAHFPRTVDTARAARRALAFEELFYFNLTLRRSAVQRGIRPSRRSGAGGRSLMSALRSRLPFTLTEDQERVLREIESDLLGTSFAARLVQGDVGCGKTLVGLLAALVVVGAGEQVAFMAPTELLARQHAETASRLLEPLGVRVGLLTSGVGDRMRRHLLDALRQDDEGGVDLLVGTHALFSEDVAYRRLGMVIIDEQQRFGVEQRGKIVAKGEGVDLLLMTATPIPRTLALTVFGDLQVSEIRSMPPGRLRVITHLAAQGKEAKVYDAVRAELEQGRQAYFVCPLIEESEESGLKDAETMHETLRDSVFPRFPCALIHSRLPEEVKADRMAAFCAGEVKVLTATSVVEVGVDVSTATCMVIEHAERFGLSQLHQLRGRVGRSREQSYAFLLYSSGITETGKQRLRVMMETTDGFRIAEEDLKLRGPGALVGVEQSGYLRFALADITGDMDLLLSARDAVGEVLEADPGLLEPAHRMIREVLSRVPPFPPEVLGGG